MKKILLIFVFPILVLASQKYPYFKTNKHGYMPKNKYDLSHSILQMNDTIDVLNIKEQVVGNSSTYGGLGDLKGTETNFRYRFVDDMMLNVNYQNTSLDYSFGNLENEKIDVSIKKNFISKVFAFDLGFIQNKANDIKVTDINVMNSRFLNSFGGKIVKEDDPFVVNKYKLVKNNSNEFIPLFEDPFISIENMRDQTVYLRATRSFVEDGIYSKDIFLEYHYTKIDSKLNSSFLNEPGLSNLIDIQTDLSRKEQKISFGVNYSWFVNRWNMDISYEFNYILRDKELSSNNTNHKIEANIGYEVIKNTIFFVGAKIMSNQYVGEIPYLLNKYTLSTFDKKYGWATTGLLYRF